ncbi:MAG: hypothetical protein [Namikivirus tsukuho]|uniref:Uncharacterized protein n=1 Tax=Bacteriophage sp. TaxID=38018 RepID=A0ABY5TRG8_9VIRU|nr:MAG: hypothetical protein [Bacteriophage sp.]
MPPFFLPIGVSHLDCGYSVRYQARKTPSHRKEKENRKMSKYTSMKTLFTALHGSLPYEYDEKYSTGTGLEDSIIISKTNSERSIYITANMPYGNNIFDLALYDDTYDDDPTEISQWDADDQDLTLLDLIAYIEKTL